MKNQIRKKKNNRMTLKDYNLSFISGVLGFILLIAPIGLIAINAEDNESVHHSVYGEDSARDDTYGNDSYDDIPEHENNLEQPDEIEKLEPGIVEVVENSVTNDVYYYYELNEDNVDYYSADEGDIFIPDAKSITFPTNLIHNLSNDNYISFYQNDTSVRIPVSSIKKNLPKDTKLEIYFNILPNWNGGSGPLFELMLLYGNGDQYVLDISGPIFIQLQIDPTTVNSWEEIVLYDIYEEEYLVYQVTYFDEQTGELEVQIDYLSGYGILTQGEADENHENPNVDENEKPSEDEDNQNNNQSVTDDVYYTIIKMDELKKHKNSDGNFVINDKVEVDIFPGVIKDMPEDKFFIISQDEIQLAIPINAMKDIVNDEIVTIEVREDPWNQEGVSKVYNIYFLLNFNEYKGSFTEPIRATFHVNPTKVNNWNDLVLGTYDAEWNLVTYKNQVIQINQNSETVESELYHLSPYGIFEVEGSGDNVEKIDTEKPSTTDDVYHTIVDEEDLTGHFDKHGNINFKNADDVVINGDVLSGLANNKSIILTQKDAELNIPVDAIKDIAGNKQVHFELKDVSNQFQDSLGTVLDFTLYIDGEKYDGKWKDAFQLTFKLDPKKVKNWDHLVLRFIDENGDVKDSKDRIVSLDKETGEVIAKVNQSGKYGIYEVEKSGMKGTATKEDNGLGSILPNTSTNTFNFLALGAILLLGGFILFINRTKQPK